MRVLDLGSGSGQDCYVLSRLVGEDGHVTGLDMTEAQVDIMPGSIRGVLLKIRRFFCSPSYTCFPVWMYQ